MWRKRRRKMKVKMVVRRNGKHTGLDYWTDYTTTLHLDLRLTIPGAAMRVECCGRFPNEPSKR
jgi:hypothetical protein